LGYWKDRRLAAAHRSNLPVLAAAVKLLWSESIDMSFDSLIKFWMNLDGCK
jgi:hypothetical protein